MCDKIFYHSISKHDKPVNNVNKIMEDEVIKIIQISHRMMTQIDNFCV